MHDNWTHTYIHLHKSAEFVQMRLEHSSFFSFCIWGFYTRVNCTAYLNREINNLPKPLRKPRSMWIFLECPMSAPVSLSLHWIWESSQHCCQRSHVFHQVRNPTSIHQWCQFPLSLAFPQKQCPIELRMSLESCLLRLWKKNGQTNTLIDWSKQS